MPELFDKHGGFRKLHSFTLATIEETGGFRERLTTKRLEARGQVAEPAPECPQCGRDMRRRRSVRGDFWGCPAYPDCRGTRPVQESASR